MEPKERNNLEPMTAKDREMMSFSTKEEPSVENEVIKEQSLEEKIKETVQQYHLEAPVTGWMISNELLEGNQIFLTMLDDYVSRAGYVIPEKEVYSALDFGAGTMPYLDAYKVFFERYGKQEHEEGRKVGITAWEGDAQVTGGSIDWITYELKDSRSLRDNFPEGFDFLTMFGCGPSSQITDPIKVEESYGHSISLLAPYLQENGLLIVTSSFGGPKRENLLKQLEDNGIEIMIASSNEYEEKLGLQLGFSHEDIIIARRKVRKNEQTE